MFGSTANVTESLTMNLLWNINRIIVSEWKIYGRLRKDLTKMRWMYCGCVGVWFTFTWYSIHEGKLMSVINLFIASWFRFHYANSVDCQWASSKNLFISTIHIVASIQHQSFAVHTMTHKSHSQIRENTAFHLNRYQQYSESCFQKYDFNILSFHIILPSVWLYHFYWYFYRFYNIFIGF